MNECLVLNLELSFVERFLLLIQHPLMVCNWPWFGSAGTRLYCNWCRAFALECIH